jgi:hypothetical protein
MMEQLWCLTSSVVGCLSEQVLHSLFEVFYFIMLSVAKVI